MEVFPKTSFFKEQRASMLPSPANIRAINLQFKNASARLQFPPPVIIPSLELVVEYGANASIVEAQTQMIVREQLHGCLPVPEIFGWAEDGGQTFHLYVVDRGRHFTR